MPTILEGIFPIRCVIPVRPSSFFAITMIENTAMIMSTARYAKIATNQLGAVCIPKNGGKITFPEPKNIANNASPKVITSRNLIFIGKPFCYSHSIVAGGFGERS